MFDLSCAPPPLVVFASLLPVTYDHCSVPIPLLCCTSSG